VEEVYTLLKWNFKFFIFPALPALAQLLLRRTLRGSVIPAVNGQW